MLRKEERWDRESVASTSSFRRTSTRRCFVVETLPKATGCTGRSKPVSLFYATCPSSAVLTTCCYLHLLSLALSSTCRQDQARKNNSPTHRPTHCPPPAPPVLLFPQSSGRLSASKRLRHTPQPQAGPVTVAYIVAHKSGRAARRRTTTSVRTSSTSPLLRARDQRRGRTG